MSTAERLKYDIIGDVHGRFDLLVQLLSLLGYREYDGVFRHETRSAIFVGDLIDRGPQQVEVVRTVRRMVEAGTALAVMGNHEFNAVAFAHHYRPHTHDNVRNHQAFLDQFADPTLYRETITWFASLPLWLDLGSLRVVHAYWGNEAIERVRETLGGPYVTTREQWELAATKPSNPHGPSLFSDVELLLKGPETGIGKYGLPKFRDKGGTVRGRMRLRWWDGDNATIRSVLDLASAGRNEDGSVPWTGGDLDQPPTPEDARFAYHDDVPVFYGHYWRKWESDDVGLTPHAACTDFSAVHSGVLAAYRFDGESILARDHFVAAVGEKGPAEH